MSVTTILSRATRDVRTFRCDVQGEPWKKQHEEALRCFELEDTLERGVNLFKLLVWLDEALRLAMARSPSKTTELLPLLRRLEDVFQYWLKPCDAVEQVIQQFESSYGPVRNAEEFRRCHAEARWMLDDPALTMDHPKIIEARDEAIDSLRAGDVS